MHTECPSCFKKHPITEKKLLLSKGEFLCNRCYITFDPNDHLSEKGLFKKNSESSSDSELDSPTDSLSEFWKYGAGLFTLILLLQIYFFKGETIAHNKTIRPVLQKVCSILNYPLAPYKNSEEFKVLKVSFDPADNGTYVLNASLINQADFSQNQPSTKLALMNYVGETFAERIFHPKDYVINNITEIKPGMMTEIKIIVAVPSEKVAGFRFELI
ncbi:MAG: DUF3426 domain-containing protein [Methylococcales bacterium]|nr:DUF3426 domain-containing protein [Methylococcales bacterium]